MAIRRGEGGLGRNLTHGMLDRLGRDIVTGKYDDTPFPTEAELTIAHGVSRSVTREAVKMLTAKGLVSARPRQGTIVEPERSWNLFDPDVLRWMLDKRFSIDLLRHFNELRVAIEPQAAYLAARNASPADLAAIGQGLERMRAAERDGGEPLDPDIAFHVAILEATHNPFYAQFRDIVGTALRSSIRFSNEASGRTASIAEHQAVERAIAQGDASAARDAMEHLIGEVLVLIDDGETSAPRRARPG